MNGILFKQEMINVIVLGRKTETRRVMNPQPHLFEEYWMWTKGKRVYALPNQGEISTELLGIWQALPYHAGQTLYVKEAWATMSCYDDVAPRDLPDTAPIWFTDTDGDNPTGCGDDMGKWRSPMFLPEKFARYHLTMTGVRIERLNAITEESAQLEGVEPLDLNGGYRVAYAMLWDTINPSMPWAKGPWVIVYQFKEGK